MSASQRRHARLKTRELANLLFPSGETVTCEIRDYCLKGLNILPTSPDKAAAVFARQAADAVAEVEFPIGKTSAPSHKIRGKLIFRSPTDIGMYVEDMPREALATLTHSRTKLPQWTETESNLLEEESQAILRDCVNLFRVFLSDAWQKLHAMIGKRIEEVDATPLPLSEQSRFLAGLAELNRDIDAISRRHFKMLVERMERIGEIEAPQTPQTSDELSIVDEHSFDDWLNITNVYSRIETDNRPAMFDFAQRFSRLTPIRITPHNDPFGPQAVCLTFQECLRGISFNNEMRAVLYRHFGDYIKSGYGKFYDQLNQLLIALKPVPPPAGKDRFEHAAGSDRASYVGTAGGGSGPMPGDTAQRLAEIAERVFSLYPPMATTPMGAIAAEQPGGAGAMVMAPQGMPAMGAPLAGMPIMGGAVAGQFGFAPGMATFPGIITPGFIGGYPGVIVQPGAINGQPLAVLATQGDLAGASGMPNLSAYFAPLRLALDTVSPQGAEQRKPPLPPGAQDQVKALLDESAAATPAGAQDSMTGHITQMLATPELSAKLPEPVREDLGTLAQTMSKAISEHAGDSDIGKLLKKTEKPVYDLALGSNKPPRLENHPLGRLINLIDRLAIVTDDGGCFIDNDFRELVNSIVDKGLGNGGLDTALIENSCVGLEKLLNYPTRVRRQRVSGYQEICEARGRIRASHQAVADELNTRFEGNSIPRVANTLVEHGWQHLLVLARLRGLEDEEQELWQALGELTADSRLGPAKANRLLNLIETRLQNASPDEKLINPLMQELAAYLNAPEKAERVLVMTGWFKPLDGQSDALPKNAEALSSKLRTGDWWDIEQDGRNVPMQLIWQSQPAGRVCFANRSAMKKLELPLAELATLHGRGKAKPGENRDTPLLERAEYWTIDSIYRGLLQQAGHDPVTKLPNRKSLLIEAAHLAKPGRESSFCVVRLNPHEQIASQCGEAVRDNLTREVAGRIGEKLARNDVLAYCGEGCFAVFMPNMSTEAARVLAGTLSSHFRNYRFQHGEQSFAIQATFGIAAYRPEALIADEALRQALAASLSAKSAGPNGIEIYNGDDTSATAAASLDKWARQIDAMFRGERLFLCCQKIIPLQDDKAQSYFEILLGVLDEDGRQVGPQSFVLAVEQWNRAHELDMWVFGKVVEWIRKHPAEFANTGGFSINLSAQSLSNGQLLSTLHRELSAGDLPCDKIVFEITETATLQSHAVAQDFIRQIRRYGCRFSLDDFGSGNASFGYLRNLRTDSLKIDGAYVKDMAEDQELQAMVRSMNDIGHALGMKTVAEYIATPELLELARNMGIDYAQGYEVAKPLALDSLMRAA